MLFSVSEYNIYCSAVYPICFVPYLVHFAFTIICLGFETIKNIVHPMLLKKKKIHNFQKIPLLIQIDQCKHINCGCFSLGKALSFFFCRQIY